MRKTRLAGGAGAAGTSGLAKFATSGAGIGTIAALAGTGVSMLSDDGDATKSNVGEYSGSILSSAGTGASVGSLLYTKKWEIWWNSGTKWCIITHKKWEIYGGIFSKWIKSHPGGSVQSI